MFETEDGKPLGAAGHDFGPVLVGGTRVDTVWLANRGASDVRIEWAGVAGARPGEFTFGSDLANSTLAAGERRALPLSFAPMTAGIRGADFVIGFGRVRGSTLALHAAGEGISECVDVTVHEVAFEVVRLGEVVSGDVRVTNASPSPARLYRIAVDGADRNAFELVGDFASGVVREIPPREGGREGELVVPAVFRPTRFGRHEASVVAETAGGCPVASGRLIGCGIDPDLSCSAGGGLMDGPELCRVDFGSILEGSRTLRSLTFVNRGSAEIVLTSWTVAGSAGQQSAFAVESGSGPFTLGPGSTSLSVAFEPDDLGAQTATLSFATADPLRPTIEVALRGVGGGPRIDAQPTELNFGQVGVNTYQYRRITIANDGVGIDGTDEDNLVLAVRDNGAWVERRAEIDDDPEGAFSLDWPPQGYTAAGLAPGANADIRVKFEPMTAGPKMATLRIYSNDSHRSELVVPLAGLGAAPPPCKIDIRPPSLNFGNVASNRYLTLAISIINQAMNPADVCTIRDLDLTPETKAENAWVLVNGPIAETTIPGGGTLQVPIRCVATQPGTYVGQVAARTSEDGEPEVIFTMTAGIPDPG